MPTTTSDLLPSISIEGLCAARDAAIAAAEAAARTLEQANEALARFSIDAVDVSFGSGSDSVRCAGRYSSRDWRASLVHIVDRQCWRMVMTKTHANAVMSTKRRKEMDEQLHGSHRYGSSTQPLPEFNAENIAATLAGLSVSRAAMFEEAIDELVRRLSWNYKTNRPGAITSKIIVNCAASSYGSGIDWNSPLFDIERVCALILGRPAPSNQTGLNAMRDDLRKDGQWRDIAYPGGEPFMRVKLFKNRNGHIEIDDRCVDEMNRVIAKRYPGAVPAAR